MCWGWNNAEWQAVPNHIARKFHSSQLCWTRQENEWSIGCCKSFHIPHLFHICRQFNCYIIWNVQNKYATYTYEYKCGRPLTATLFQLRKSPPRRVTLQPIHSFIRSFTFIFIIRPIWFVMASCASSAPSFPRHGRFENLPPTSHGTPNKARIIFQSSHSRSSE